MNIPTTANCPAVGTLERSSYIGSSDAAAILGLSPWKTPLAVYRRLRGEVEHEEAGKSAIFTRGKRLEPYILDAAEDFIGVAVQVRGQRYRSEAHPFMAAELDGEVTLESPTEVAGQMLSAGQWSIEAKSVHFASKHQWGEEGTDAIPLYYAAQAMHVQHCRQGLLGTIFLAAFGFDDIRAFIIRRDEASIASVIAREVEFWDATQAGVEPAPVSMEDIKAMFPRDNGTTREATMEAMQAITRLSQVKAEAKILDAEESKLTADIALAFGDAATLTAGGKAVATYKAQDANRIDADALRKECPDIAAKYTKQTTSRVLRLK